MVNAVYAEPDAPAQAGPGVAAAIAALARWLGASDISLGERRPALWDHALRDLAWTATRQSPPVTLPPPPMVSSDHVTGTGDPL